MDSSHPVRILVVDDEPLIAEELKELLEHAGYNVTTCHTALDALQAFQQDHRIGIILSDIHMPGLTGLRLVEELANLAAPGRLYEIALFTGNADKQDVIQALRAGVSDYYEKPVDPGELSIGVSRLCERLEQKTKDQQIKLRIQALAASLHDIHIDTALTPTSTSVRNVGYLPSPSGFDIPEPFDKLSKRQLAVTQLIAKGMTNYQISCELGITENTVKLYVSQILRLTRAHNRTQLALSYPSHASYMN